MSILYLLLYLCGSEINLKTKKLKTNDQKKAREGMKKMRLERTEEEKLDDQEKAKEGMKKVRSGRTEEEILEIKA